MEKKHAASIYLPGQMKTCYLINIPKILKFLLKKNYNGF